MCAGMLNHFSSVHLFVTPRTVAYQAPLSMGFPRQDYWSGLPFLSLGDLPDSRIEPWPPALQGDCLPSESPGKPTSTPLQYSYLENPMDGGAW